MSRRPILSLVSALVSALYLFAIVGFDIHIDHHCNEVYVVSLLASLDCESIHPEDECHCCDHHHGADEDDCDNLVEALEFAGDPAQTVLSLSPAVTPSFGASVPGLAASLSAGVSFVPAPSSSPGGLLQMICVMRA